MNKSILSQDEVLKKGIEFTGDVCYSGEYGQQVYNLPIEEGGKPITGYVYEKYNNGNINYYCYYENGIKDGECIDFYETGKLKRHCMMEKGQILGKNYIWYENGNIKTKEFCKYGIVMSYKKFDEDGNIIDSKKEPNHVEKSLLEKYERLYESHQTK
ncbi:hypothetical protein AN1V17_40920 [Vallitalea sediminicola]